MFLLCINFLLLTVGFVGVKSWSQVYVLHFDVVSKLKVVQYFLQNVIDYNKYMFTLKF